MKQQRPDLLEIRRVVADCESESVYDELHEETGLSQFESFYLWLMDQLHLAPGNTLLDVSCGAGEVVRLAAEAGLQAAGIDISRVAARTARANLTSSSLICAANGERLPFADASFDYVTNIGSLEHFADPEAGVREMARVLRPGGEAFVLVPNTFSLLFNIWHAFRTGQTAADDQPIQRYGARADWILLLQNGGLIVRQTRKYERIRPRRWADWPYYLRRPKELMRLMLSPFVPLNLSFCFLFICQRAALD